MDYKEKLKKVAVLGAAGKMGSGITLVTLLEQAKLKFENKDEEFVLFALDISETALNGLLKYLRANILKAAEKDIVNLRKLYHDNPNVIENYDLVDQYVNDVMEIIRPVTKIENTYGSTLVFEAVIENPDLKTDMFNKIKDNSDEMPWFLTNTSSVPISELDEKSNLKGNIIGFHFYNPPAVQRLVELITSPGTNDLLKSFSLDFAKRIKKTIVPANDVAGFIGNGHFMRDLLYGIKKVTEISGVRSFAASVHAVNQISQEYLVRPMGIFQLIDYVGLDVCQKILKVMYDRLDEKNLQSELINDCLSKGIKGGQHSDGSQKNGFLKYEKNKIVGVLDDKTCDYIDIVKIVDESNEIIGTKPDSILPWKATLRAKNKEELLQKHFDGLAKTNSEGSKIAFEYLANSKAIGEKLVKDNVALDTQGVNDVLELGFFHAYGPINNFVK
jgi:3-hydroxybutyryl-CoA dehydrogenase